MLLRQPASLMKKSTNIKDVVAMRHVVMLGSIYGYLAKIPRRNEGIKCGMFSFGLTRAPPSNGLS